MANTQQRKKTTFAQAPAVPSNDVEFAIRGPLPATWGADEDHRSRPGSCILDLLFSSPNKVGELVFRNYYTAWLTVLVRVAPSVVPSNPGTPPTGRCKPTLPRSNLISRGEMQDGAQGGWKVSIPRRVLMPFPHQETGSHDVVSITATESIVEWNNLQAMRLLLQQPSPVWRTFHVEEISVMRDVPRRLHRMPPTPSSAGHHIGATCEQPATGTIEPEKPAQGAESRLLVLRDQTLVALKKSNAPEREGPPPKDFVATRFRALWQFEHPRDMSQLNETKIRDGEEWQPPKTPSLQTPSHANTILDFIKGAM